MSHVNYLRFLFVYPQFQSQHYYVISNGANILEEGSKTESEIRRAFPNWCTVMCNVYNPVIQTFKTYAFLCLPGIEHSADIETVRSALVFSLHDRRPLQHVTGHLVQNTLLMLVRNGDMEVLIDNKGHSSPAAKAGQIVLPAEFFSHYHLILTHPEHTTNSLGSIVHLDPSFATKPGEYVNFWCQIRVTKNSLYASSPFRNTTTTTTGILASEAMKWMNFGAALAESSLSYELALSALNVDSPTEMVNSPPELPVFHNANNPICAFVTSILQQQREKSISSRALLQKVNLQFGLTLGLSDMCTILNLLGGVSSGTESTVLLWTD